MLNVKPRQGFMFVAPIKNPWGEMVGNIDISPMTKATPGSWRQVCGVADDRVVEGRVVASEYRVGDAVYLPRDSAQPFVMGERTVGLVHESQVTAFLRAGDYSPVYVDASTAAVLAEFQSQVAQAQRPALAVPGNGRLVGA